MVFPTFKFSPWGTGKLQLSNQNRYDSRNVVVRNIDRLTYHLSYTVQACVTVFANYVKFESIAFTCCVKKCPKQLQTDVIVTHRLTSGWGIGRLTLFTGRL